MIHSDDPEHGKILLEALDKSRPFQVGHDRCISFTHEGKLLGGVVYDRYHGNSIQMHVLVLDKRVVTRRNLFVCFHYPFVALGCGKVIAMVPSTNEAALSFDLRIGFVEKTRIEGAVPGGDLVVLCMERHQCKWLGE